MHQVTLGRSTELIKRIELAAIHCKAHQVPVIKKLDRHGDGRFTAAISLATSNPPILWRSPVTTPSIVPKPRRCQRAAGAGKVRRLPFGEASA